MSKFAILRSEKITSFSALSGSSNHNSRVTNCPSADKLKSESNRYEYYGGASNTLQAFDNLQNDLDFKIKKGNVLAREFVLSFSPEMKENIDVDEWISENKKWLESKYGGESKKGKLISFEVHLDESTPHIHATVVPAIYKKYYGKMQWCLNEKEIHGDKILSKAKEKMSKMQDDYASHMKPLGLERGLRGSTAEHQEIKKFYTNLNQRIKRMEKASKKELVEIKQDEQEADSFKKLSLNGFDRAKNMLFKYMNKCKKVLQENILLKEKIKELRADYSKLRESSAKYKRQLTAVARLAETGKFSELKEFVVVGSEPYRTAKAQAAIDEENRKAARLDRIHREHEEAMKFYESYEEKDPAITPGPESLDKKLAVKNPATGQHHSYDDGFKSP